MNFFNKEFKSKKKSFFFFFFLMGEWREPMDGQTNRPKPFCPFNFSEVGGITMN